MNLRQLRVELLKMASGMPGALVARDKPPADLAIELARKFEGYVREGEEPNADEEIARPPEPPVEEQAPRRGRPPKRKVEKPGARRRGRPRKKGDPIFE